MQHSTVFLAVALLASPLVCRAQVLNTCGFTPDDGKQGFMYDLRPLHNSIFATHSTLDEYYYLFKMCGTIEERCVGSPNPNDGMVLQYASAHHPAPSGETPEPTEHPDHSCLSIAARWDDTPRQEIYSYDEKHPEKGFKMALENGDLCSGDRKRRITFDFLCDKDKDPLVDGVYDFDLTERPTGSCQYFAELSSKYGCPVHYCGLADATRCQNLAREPCEKSGDVEQCGPCLFGYKADSGADPALPGLSQCSEKPHSYSMGAGQVVLVMFIFVAVIGTLSIVAYCWGIRKGQALGSVGDGLLSGA